MLIDIQVQKVRTSNRHRKDMGDLQSLAESIEKVGLLQPIGITDQHNLVFGERRLRAVRNILKRETITARIVHIGNIVDGEYHENEIRKDFTPSERVAIGKAVEEQFGNRQGKRTDIKKPELPVKCPEVLKERQTGEELVIGLPQVEKAEPASQATLQHNKLPANLPEVSQDQRTNKEPRKNICEVPTDQRTDQIATEKSGEELVAVLPQVNSGKKTREIAAKTAGFSSTTQYRQAKKVVETAAPNVVEAMDQNVVSINAAAKIAKSVPVEEQENLSMGDIRKMAKEMGLKQKTLPSPKEAKEISQETGDQVLASDGQYHACQTPEQKQQEEEWFIFREALWALAEISISPQAFAEIIPYYQVPNINKKLPKISRWLSEFKQAWEKKNVAA